MSYIDRQTGECVKERNFSLGDIDQYKTVKGQKLKSGKISEGGGFTDEVLTKWGVPNSSMGFRRPPTEEWKQNLIDNNGVYQSNKPPKPHLKFPNQHYPKLGLSVIDVQINLWKHKAGEDSVRVSRTFRASDS